MLSPPDPVSLDPALLNALDRAIDDRAEDAFGFLERLVAAPSTVGREMTAQQVVRDELDRLGFETSVQPIGEDIAADPVAGVPQRPYAGRGNVIGHLGAGSGPSLLLNGHIDVVPAEAPLWSAPPFRPVRRDGWLLGRGSGDMKGGFALASLALGALQAAAPGWLRAGSASPPSSRRSARATGRSPRPAPGCWPTRPCFSSRPTWGCCSAAWGSSGPS